MDKKEEIIRRFRTVPNRKISDIEKQLVHILIEKSKLQRERSIEILNKGFTVFIVFIAIAFLSRVFGGVSQAIIMGMFAFGIVVLVVSIALYNHSLTNEQEILDSLLESFLR